LERRLPDLAAPPAADVAGAPGGRDVPARALDLPLEVGDPAGQLEVGEHRERLAAVDLLAAPDQRSRDHALGHGPGTLEAQRPDRGRTPRPLRVDGEQEA